VEDQDRTLEGLMAGLYRIKAGLGRAHGRTVKDQGRTVEGSCQGCRGLRQDFGGLSTGLWRIKAGLERANGRTVDDQDRAMEDFWQNREKICAWQGCMWMV
jgi:hypothetical protein